MLNIITAYYIKVKVKLATVVEGDPKAPFSIATTLRFRGGCYSFPGLLHFTLDPYLIMLSVKQGGIKYHFFESLVWLDLGLNFGLPDHWRTLYSLGQWPGQGQYIYIYIYIYIYVMSVKLSSLPGKFKCSLLNSFLVLMELLPTPV